MPECGRRPKDPNHGGDPCNACKNLRRLQREARSAKGLCAANTTCSNPKAEGYAYCNEHRKRKRELQANRRVTKRGRGRPTGPCATLEPSILTAQALATLKQAPENVLHPPPTEWDTILWATFLDDPPFDQSNTLAIQFFSDDRAVLGYDAWLEEAADSTLGEAVVVPVEDGFRVHQGFVTILAVRSMSPFSVVAQTWEWLTAQLANHLLHATFQDSDGQSQNAVIFIHWTTEEPENMTLDDAYAAIRMFKHIHGAKVRPYPSESEAWQERAKIGDIRALDEIAESSPLEYSYRPRTCYGHGSCRLVECEITVHKRSHSCSAKHIIMVQNEEETRELTCTSELTSESRRCPKKKQKKKPSDLQPHWFHQEFVPSLRDFEFRVYIATKPDPGGVRGKSGYIVAMAKTALNWETQTLASKSVEPEDFGPQISGSLTLSDLQQTSLYIFERLRIRGDSFAYFESLEVGARLDIGIGDDNGEKRFFVNEITRWYGAHYFSNNICPEPKTQICKAFARSFSDYVQHGMPETF